MQFLYERSLAERGWWAQQPLCKTTLGQSHGIKSLFLHTTPNLPTKSMGLPCVYTNFSTHVLFSTECNLFLRGASKSTTVAEGLEGGDRAELKF